MALLEYFRHNRDEANNILIYKPKTSKTFKYHGSLGDVESTTVVEDTSDMQRGKIVVLDDILEMAAILEKQGQLELERMAAANKKEKEDGSEI